VHWKTLLAEYANWADWDYTLFWQILSGFSQKIGKNGGFFAFIYTVLGGFYYCSSGAYAQKWRYETKKSGNTAGSTPF